MPPVRPVPPLPGTLAALPGIDPEFSAKHPDGDWLAGGVVAVWEPTATRQVGAARDRIVAAGDRFIHFGMVGSRPPRLGGSSRPVRRRPAA